MRTVIPGRDIPLYVRAQEIRQLSSTEFMARKARVSTSEFYTPHVHLGAEEITLVDATPRTETGQIAGLEAGQYRARDVTLNVEGVPIAYWPYTAGDFRREEAALESMRVFYSDDFGMSVHRLVFVYPAGRRSAQRRGSDSPGDYFGSGAPLSVWIPTSRRPPFGLFRGIHQDHGDADLGPFRTGPCSTTSAAGSRGEPQYQPQGWQLTSRAPTSATRTSSRILPAEFETDKEQETSST